MNLIRNFESTLSQTTDSGGVGELRVLQTKLKRDVGLNYGEVSVFSLEISHLMSLSTWTNTSRSPPTIWAFETENKYARNIWERVLRTREIHTYALSSFPPPTSRPANGQQQQGQRVGLPPRMKYCRLLFRTYLPSLSPTRKKSTEEQKNTGEER